MRVTKLSRTAARRAVRLRRMTRRAGALVSSIPERRHLLQQGALALAAAAIIGGIYLTRGDAPSAGSGDTAAATPAEANSLSSVAAPSPVASAALNAAPPTDTAAQQTPPAAEDRQIETAETKPAESAAPSRPRFEVPPLESEPAETKATGVEANSAPPAASAVSGTPVVEAPAKAPPTLSFRDDRALDPMKDHEAGQPSGTPSPETAAPVARPAVSFRDERAIDSTPSAAAPPAEVAAAGASMFRDERALDSKPRFSAPDTLPAASFRDERRLATPSFKDPRPADASLFQDNRPAASVTFKDERALTAEAGPATAPAATEAEKKAEDEGTSNPFEVGYFLGDRSPMARQQEQPPSTAAPSPENAPAPAQTPAAAVQPQATPPAAAADGSLPTLVALAPGQLKLDGIACVAPEVATEALDGGLMRMRVTANCHPNEFVQISYGGAEFIRKLNSYGALDYVLDCFAGSSSAVEVRFADGVTRQVSVTAKDLDKVSKIAVVWRAGVNLDLHVFEYAAKFGENGHFWSGSPSGFVAAQVQGQADQRGHGFLSATDDDKTLGDKLEVYTFLHNDQQASGAISLALDNATRGEMPSGPTCGQGALAEIGFQVSILPRNGQVTRQSGVLTRVECGTKLTHEARFNQSAMPGLRIRR